MSGPSNIVNPSPIDEADVTQQQQQQSAAQQQDQDVDRQNTLTNLRRKKRVGKTQLTKAKLFLTSQLCSPDVEAGQVRNSIDNVIRCQDDVLNILLTLCDIDADSYEQELEYVQSDPNLQEVLSKATDFIAKSRVENETGASDRSSTPDIAQNDSSHSRVDRDLFHQLTRVSIAKFSGNKRDYTLFRESFNQCIDKSSMTKSYKLLQLRQHLDGDALKAIEGFPPSDIGYDAALNRLDEKYGGPRRNLLILLNDIHNFKPISFSDLKMAEEFVDTLELSIISLRDGEHTEEFKANSMFFCVVKSKLQSEHLANYKRWIALEKKDENLISLHEWLAGEIKFRTEAREEASGFVSTSSNRSPSKYNSNSHKIRNNDHRTKTFATGGNPEFRCVVCNESHIRGVQNCQIFKSFEIPRRWAVAKDKNLCFRCLSPTHRGSRCRNSQKCMIDGCQRTHHSLLHGTGSDQVRQNPSFPKPNYYSPLSDSQSARTHTQFKNDSLAMRIVPVFIVKNDRRLKVNALLDECSTDSYVSEYVKYELGLQGETINLNVDVLGGSKTSLKSDEVTFGVSSVDGFTSFSLDAFTVKNVTGGLTSVDWLRQSCNWPHLRGIPFPEIAQPTHIDLLIGLNAVQVHRSHSEIVGQPGEPIARLTCLGWTCIGPISPVRLIKPNPRIHYAQTFYIRNDESNLDSLLKQMWDVEQSGISKQKLYTPSESEAIVSTKRSLVFDVKKQRYCVGIPWRANKSKLLTVSNFDVAKLRLQNLENSLKRKPSIAEQYRSIISDHEQKGYIEEVFPCDVSKPSWYLPHFAVIRMDKSTTKVRVVMDAAARCRDISLNDVIHPGPKLQSELFDVLVRFRHKPIALAADITEMFLQIEMQPEDKNFHRFLWRDLDNTSPIKIYQYNRLVFGNTSSPYLSQAVLREHANVNINNYPFGANSILNSMYVDDLLDSVDSTSEALQLRRELTTLLQSAGFSIRKWLSNDTEVLSDIPIKDRVGQLSIEDNSLPSVKTLGILWNAERDIFTFHVSEPSYSILTKRDIVSKTASLFDPLNFLAPFLIRAKIGIQEAWIRGFDWDTPLPDDLIKSWDTWFSELQLLQNLEIPRCIVFPKLLVIDRTLHVFVDASSKAYAASCYLRSQYDDYSISVVLVAAKCRVAPLKALSIPRLELCGAILGLRLSITIRDVLDISQDKVLFWSDSQNVLFWIRGESRNYKPFVSHRVGEIHESSNPMHWRWVPTKLNSADSATRGLSVTELKNCDLWWYGPNFLKQDASLWPVSANFDPPEAKEEVRENQSATFVTVPKVVEFGRLDPSRYSNWLKLVRVTAWIFRFINNCRKSRDSIKSQYLESLELAASKTFWFRQAQKDDLADEVKTVSKGENVKSDSKLYTLNPTLDENGVLRVNGRLGQSENLSYQSKHPVILPSKHDVTRLVVKFVHDSGNHNTGVSHVLSELRTEFWIIRARDVVKSVQSSCNTCKRIRTKPAQQVMAPLPNYRLGTPLRAFARVGMDYAGPFMTKQLRGRVRCKRYLCLFTCLASRAVHLEMAWALDTDSFLCAFTRFCSRRGRPIQVLSDNGSNFIGANRELKALLEQLDQNTIGNSLSNRNIEWHFNPPLTPHFGGVFESLIKSSKRAIKAIIGEADITDEELETAFVNAEGIINSRPLCYQGDDASDNPVLTPNHFLFGQAGGQLAPESVDYTPFNPRLRWRRIQELMQHFWKRWLKEFIPMLNSRKKWHSTHRDFVEGDIVLVIDPQSARGKWPLGKILKVYPGLDGHVRVVDIKVGDKEYRRNINRLCPLEVCTSTPGASA